MGFEQQRREDGAGAGWAGAAGGLAPGKRTRVETLQRRPEPVDAAPEPDAEPDVDQEAEVGATSPDDAPVRAHGLGDTAPRPPDLQSPRFAGEAQLEACYDDRARLTLGARGPAVQKVQAALIELGYDLGPQGADGVYRQGTWNAVKKFKAAEKLGWESMGDVGPGTMGRLDQLFAGPSPSRPRGRSATEGEDPSLEHLVVTHDSDTPALDPAELAELAELELPPEPDHHAILAMMIEAPPEGDVGVATGDGPEPTGHLSIEQAVAKFKAQADVVDASDAEFGKANVSQMGQFFWSQQVENQLQAEIASIGAEPDGAEFAARAKKATTKIGLNKGFGDDFQEAAKLARAAKPPLQARMLRLFRGYTGGGGTLEALLWHRLKKAGDDKLPDLSEFRSMITLHTFLAFDNVACAAHALTIARRVKGKGGVTVAGPDTPKSTFRFAMLANGMAHRDQRPTGEGDKYQLGDVLGQKGVGAVLQPMRDALDAGELLHARVVSGIGVGLNDGPKADAKPMDIPVPLGGEHQILIIGYDGDQFVFHDPDASVSHDPEAGFGRLYYDSADDRLSTASEAKLLPVDAPLGKHESKNKRYQVIYVARVP